MDNFDLREYLYNNRLTKPIITECYYVSQWLDIIKKYPEIIDLLKKDVALSTHKSLFGSSNINWGDLDSIAYKISNFGGICGLDGMHDFNLNSLKPFILDDMVDDDFSINIKTAERIFSLVEKYFTQQDKNVDWISIEYDRIIDRLGQDQADKWLKMQKNYR